MEIDIRYCSFCNKVLREVDFNVCHSCICEKFKELRKEKHSVNCARGILFYEDVCSCDVGIEVL